MFVVCVDMALRSFSPMQIFHIAFLLNPGAGGVRVFRGALLAIPYAQLHSHFMEPKKSYSRQPQC
jgi:ABC-type amino acid transport system permease subunit